MKIERPCLPIKIVLETEKELQAFTSLASASICDIVEAIGRVQDDNLSRLTDEERRQFAQVFADLYDCFYNED